MNRFPTHSIYTMDQRQALVKLKGFNINERNYIYTILFNIQLAKFSRNGCIKLQEMWKHYRLFNNKWEVGKYWFVYKCNLVGTLSGFTWFKHPWVDLGTRRVLKGRVQTFSWKILSLQQFTFESRKGWVGGKG